MIIEPLKTIGFAILILFFLYLAARVVTKGVMKSYSEYKERSHYGSETQEEDHHKEAKTTGKNQSKATAAAETDTEEEEDALRRAGQNEKGLA